MISPTLNLGLATIILAIITLGVCGLAHADSGFIDEYGGESVDVSHMKPSELLAEARNGNPAAMRRLGKMLIEGKGVRKEVKTGILWLRKAAEEDDSSAMLLLGDLYRNGRGVKKDLKTALNYYLNAHYNDNKLALSRIKKLPLRVSLDSLKKLCKSGNTEAMYYLGTRSAKVRAGLLSDADANNYLIQAALKKHPEAVDTIENAPIMHYLPYWDKKLAYASADDLLKFAKKLENNGQCTPEEKKVAIEYYKRAAKKGRKEADEWLAKNVPDYAAKKKEEEAREKARQEKIAASGNTRRYVVNIIGHVMEMRTDSVLFLSSDSLRTYFRLIVDEQFQTAMLFREQCIRGGLAVRLKYGDRLYIDDEIIQLDNKTFRGLIYIAITGNGLKGYILQGADDNRFWVAVD